MKTCRFHIFFLTGSILLPASLYAIPVSIPLPGGGTVVVDVSHAGPTGQLVDPDPPDAGVFHPPTLFAAPLPVGSGARALGQAGAFTAVADDATAASWNPAGLTQLESAEVSAVYRFSAREDKHESRNGRLDAGTDRYHSSELNYLSAVYPFLLSGNNAVVSINYQEAYDFTQEFNARFQGNGQENVDTLISEDYVTITTNNVVDPFKTITGITETRTTAQSRINQVLNSALLTGIEFRQSGTIDAISPAFAFALGSRFSMGITLNIHTDGASRGNPIESTLVADYAGTSDSAADVLTTRSSVATISIEGEEYTGPPFNPVTNPVSVVIIAPFSNVETNMQADAYTVDGVYREDNRTEDFYGINATLGALWAATDNLQIGATLDLPWTGRGKQTKHINHQLSTFDSNLVQVASNTHTETQHRDVEYTFPLYWSVGALWRWTDRFYTSFDVSQTLWSDYSYKAEGESRINPINGDPYSNSSIDDCWSARLGTEYLWMLSWAEIPLRGGLFWEQRPATGSPDEYWGFSLGSGMTLADRVVLDIAYILELGKNVQGSLLPGQAVHSDTTKHQIFCSAIWHF